MKSSKGGDGKVGSGKDPHCVHRKLDLKVIIFSTVVLPLPSVRSLSFQFSLVSVKPLFDLGSYVFLRTILYLRLTTFRTYGVFLKPEIRSLFFQ